MSHTQAKISSLNKLTALVHGENLSIEGVLDSFGSLQKVSIPDGIGVSRSGKVMMQPREDIIVSSTPSGLELLDCSRQRVVARQISLSSIMHGE